MNIEDLRSYCLSKKNVTEGFPFDKTTLVFKVMEKIFALTDIEGEFRVNLKCNPAKAIEYRERYPEIIPAYHMNKKHWNTIIIDGNLSDDFIQKMIDDSYNLIVEKLPKKIKTDL
jgi:predicted DNA-binding protein (MmcQ/YjbR family)